MGYNRLPTEPPVLNMVKGKGIQAIDDSNSEESNDSYKQLPMMQRKTVFQK